MGNRERREDACLEVEKAIADGIRETSLQLNLIRTVIGKVIKKRENGFRGLFIRYSFAAYRHVSLLSMESLLLE